MCFIMSISFRSSRKKTRFKILRLNLFYRRSPIHTYLCITCLTNRATRKWSNYRQHAYSVQKSFVFSPSAHKYHPVAFVRGKTDLGGWHVSIKASRPTMDLSLESDIELHITQNAVYKPTVNISFKPENGHPRLNTNLTNKTENKPHTENWIQA